MKNFQFFPFLITFLLFYRFNDDNLNGLWMQRWAILLTGICLFYSWNIAQRCKPLGLLTLTTCLSGISVVFWFHRYHDEPFELQSALRQSCAMALVTFAALGVFTRTLSMQHLRSARMAFGFCGWLTSVVIIAWKLLGHDVTRQVPLFDNPSMSASFAACTYLLSDYAISHLTYLRKMEYKWWDHAPRALVLATTITAVLLTKATTPLLVFVSGVGVYLALSGYWWQTLLATSAPVAAALLFSPWKELIDSTGRFNFWRWCFEWWERNAYGCAIGEAGCHWYRIEHLWTWAFGQGVGTMRVWMPLIQADNGETLSHGQWFFWMHNDWLQVLLEQGVLGGVALLWFAGWLLWEARKSPKSAGSLVAFGAMMFTNFPLHMPLQAFLVFVLAQTVILMAEKRASDLRRDALKRGVHGIC